MRRALALVAAGLVLLAGGGAGLLWPARAQETAGGGAAIYDLKTSAVAVREILDTANNPLPTDRTAELSIPYAVADLANGSGHGVASTFWPGDAGANACAAVPEFPCYPIRAETFHPQGPAEANNPMLPGSTMVSSAKETEVRSVASTAAVGAEVAGTSAIALSTVKDGLAISEATASVQAITIGPVKIEGIVSYAKATSDGAKADVVGRTVVTGLTVNGQAAAIDENGVHVAGQGTANPLAPGGPLAPLADVLKQAGITLTLTNPVKSIEGAKGEVVTGGLLVTLDNNPFVSQIPPEVLGAIQIPGFGGIPPLGGKTTLILGQAAASSSGNPGFGEFTPGDLPDIVSDVGTPVEPPPVEDAAGSVEVAGSTSTQELGSSGTRPSSSPPVAVAGTSRSLPAGKSVGAALVTMSLVGAGLAGFGLRKLATGAFAAGGATACPLENS